MTSNMRYEPFWSTGRRESHVGDPLFERFEQMLREAVGMAQAGGEPGQAGAQVNLYDTADGYWLELPLPGVKAENLDLSVQQNLLTLKASREWVAPERAQVLWQGFGGGRWQQTFSLPGEVDADRVEARLADGVLRLHLPKAQHLRPRQITVQAGGEAKAIAPANGTAS